MELARKAVTISRETAIKFVGARCLGILASVTEDEDEREAVLLEGESIIVSGCAALNHPHFYRDAMEIRLHQGRFHEVERYASALVGQFSSEPIGWSDYYAAWGRVLATHGRGEADPRLIAELSNLRNTAVEKHLHRPRPLIEVALESSRSGD